MAQIANLPLYDTRNPRFRRAYIRDRLAEIKAERAALMRERDENEAALPNSTQAKVASQEADATIEHQVVRSSAKHSKR